MRVRWTTDAADDLERICDYIAEFEVDAAGNVTGLVLAQNGRRLPGLKKK